MNKISHFAVVCLGIMTLNGCYGRSMDASLNKNGTTPITIGESGQGYVVQWSKWQKAKHYYQPIFSEVVNGWCIVEKDRYAFYIGRDKLVTDDNINGDGYIMIISVGSNPVTMTRYLWSGDDVRDIDDLIKKNASAQQVDSAEPSTNAVPPSMPSGSAR